MDDIVKSGHPAVISTLVMGVLATVATSLRFLAKLETKAGLAADDYWIMISLATYWAYTAVTLWAVFKGGGGMDMPNIVKGDVTGITIYIQSLIINACLFITSLTAVKLAIVFYYRRIFSVQVLVKRCTFVVGIISICWWWTMEFGTIFFCVPLKKFWAPAVPGHCTNYGIFFLITAIVDLVLDVTLLCLPIWVTCHLQLPRRQQWSLALIFLLGGFICITAVIRIIYTYIPGSNRVALGKGLVWTNIHVGAGLVCASLPTLRPLMLRWTRSLSTLRQGYDSKYQSRSRSNDSGWKRMNKETTYNKTTYNKTDYNKETHLIMPSYPGRPGDQSHYAEAVGGAQAEHDLEACEGQPLNSITVKRTINVD